MEGGEPVIDVARKHNDHRQPGCTSQLSWKKCLYAQRQGCTFCASTVAEIIEVSQLEPEHRSDSR